MVHPNQENKEAFSGAARFVQGEDALPIYAAMGVMGDRNNDMKAEVRESNDEISILAYSNGAFTKIAQFPNGDLELTKTDPGLRRMESRRVTLSGEVKVLKQDWDPASGNTGAPEPLEISNPREVVTEVRDIARKTYKAALKFIERPW